GNHTKLPYNKRKHREEATLCQLQTGRSRLNYSLEKLGVTDSDTCECDGRTSDTVRHFIFEGPRWEAQRRKPREVAGSRWKDLSYF
ncbi:uncharacterized protein BDR25DRAFT_233632, partial [Lindgomyces ingoldianus]